LAVKEILALANGCSILDAGCRFTLWVFGRLSKKGGEKLKNTYFPQLIDGAGRDIIVNHTIIIGKKEELR